MKTLIFKTYEDFLNREDKRLNGVSEEFAKNNPDYEQDNETNESCWNCSDCSYCSGCSYCIDCIDCSGCRSCSGCRDCSDCSSCRSCIDCSDCSDCSGKTDSQRPEIPKIEDIHKKVYSAVSAENALDMESWHTCDTTHCRAGWVVHLAGEAGKALESFHNTCLAAQLIYRASGYEINPCRFFDSNENAMADIKRLAEAE